MGFVLKVVCCASEGVGKMSERGSYWSCDTGNVVEWVAIYCLQQHDQIRAVP
jgi:hypothetical protein